MPRRSSIPGAAPARPARRGRSPARRPPRVIGIDRHPWALAEAADTYRVFGIAATVRQADIATATLPTPLQRFSPPSPVNELADPARERAAPAAARTREPAGSRVRRRAAGGFVAPWWKKWREAFESAGGRADEVAAANAVAANCREARSRGRAESSRNHRPVAVAVRLTAATLLLSMTSHWEMRVALAALDDEALAIAPLRGGGSCCLPATGCVSYQMRHQWGTHVNILPVEDLPSGLRTPISGVRQIGPISQDDGPIEATHVTTGHRHAGGDPLPGDLGLFWAGSGSRAFPEAQVEGARESSRSDSSNGRAEPESDESRARRLERLESLSDVLPLIARALDLRDVFERLSDVARRALPHDTVRRRHPQRGSRAGPAARAERRRRSLGALPEVACRTRIRKRWPSAASSPSSATSSAHPFEQAGVGARLGPAIGAAAAAVARRPRSKAFSISARSRPGRYSEADLPIARRIADYVTLRPVATRRSPTRRSAPRRWPSAPPT